MTKNVQIVLDVPLDSFIEGDPLEEKYKKGDILDGKWINIRGAVKGEIIGLPKGTDVRVSIGYQQKLVIKHVTAKKDRPTKAPAKEAAPVKLAFVK